MPTVLEDTPALIRKQKPTKKKKSNQTNKQENKEERGERYEEIRERSKERKKGPIQSQAGILKEEDLFERSNRHFNLCMVDLTVT